MTKIPKVAQAKQTALPVPQAAASPYKTLTIDYDLYEQYLEDSDLNEDQKREFLDTLWNIIVNFVDLGFGVHPLQQVTDQSEHHSACEQNALPFGYLTTDSGNMVDSNNNPKTEFRHAADDCDQPWGGRNES